MNQFVPKESWTHSIMVIYIIVITSSICTINNTITPAIISFVLIYAVYTYDKLK